MQRNKFNRQNFTKFDEYRDAIFRESIELRWESAYVSSKWNIFVPLHFKENTLEKEFNIIYKHRSKNLVKSWSILLFLISFAFSLFYPFPNWNDFPPMSNLLVVIVVYFAWDLIPLRWTTFFLLVSNFSFFTIQSAILKRFPEYPIWLLFLSHSTMRQYVTMCLLNGVLATAIFNIVYLYYFDMPEAVLTINMYFLFINILGILIGYFFEFQERSWFVNVKLHLHRSSLIKRELERMGFLLKSCFPQKILSQIPFLTTSRAYDTSTVAFISIMDLPNNYYDSMEGFEELHFMMQICERRVYMHRCVKVKSIGNIVMVVSGVPEMSPDHAENMADMLLGIQQDLDEINVRRGAAEKRAIRAGVCSGPLVAGVIGSKRFHWDIWGSTVNIASRLDNPKVGPELSPEIRIGQSVSRLLGSDYKFKFEKEIDMRGLRKVKSYILTGKKNDIGIPDVDAFDLLRPFPLELESEPSVLDFIETERDIPFSKSLSYLLDTLFLRKLSQTRRAMKVILIFHICLGFIGSVNLGSLTTLGIIFQFGIVTSWILFHTTLVTIFNLTPEVGRFLSIVTLLLFLLSAIIFNMYMYSKLTVQIFRLFDTTLITLSTSIALGSLVFDLRFWQIILLIVFSVFVLLWLVWQSSWISPENYVYVGMHILSCIILSNIWVSIQMHNMKLEECIQETSAQLLHDDLASTKHLSREILCNIFPRKYVKLLLGFTHIRDIREKHEFMCYMTCDIAGFTYLSKNIGAPNLIFRLNELFSRFDRLSDEFRMEKIKTIGDAYILCTDLDSKESKEGKVETAFKMAFAMRDQIRIHNRECFHLGGNIGCRIAIDVGPIWTGTIGHTNLQFDAFGDIVKRTEELEKSGRTTAVHVSRDFYELVNPGLLMQIAVEMSKDGNSFFITRNGRGEG